MLTCDMTLREATDADVPALAAAINAAFVVERFFKIGDRTSPDETRARMRRGSFLILEDAGQIVAAIYVSATAGLGYFGTLSVHPGQQGRGLGRRMAEAAENWCRARGCREMEIEVVNLRTELPPFYRRLGYLEAGTRPFPDAERSTMPCHFIVMRKALV
jgi:GNAT superfamily N-acetyltransferase